MSPNAQAGESRLGNATALLAFLNFLAPNEHWHPKSLDRLRRAGENVRNA